VDIMEDHNPIDIEREAERWRAEGWTPAEYRTERHEREVETRERPETTRRTKAEKETELKEVEEELHVGKREVETGGVRVRQHVIKEPVEEEVRLREEEVHVERRDVDRPASEAELSEMERREGETIEMRESKERAVVEKEARVTGEVEVEKEAREKTEKISDTVRRVEVDVEEFGTEDHDVFERHFEERKPQFRQHYQREVHDDHPYSYYEPGYHYGYELGSSQAYRNRSWDEVEPIAHRRWEQRNQGTWDRFKEVVHEGYVRAKRAA
jgi:uncharacterized protein (TIGR02271 family)